MDVAGGSPLWEQLRILNTVYLNAVTPTPSATKTTNIIKTPLLPHQQTLQAAMYSHMTRMTNGCIIGDQIINGKLGIVADPPGTGKTLTILSYLASIKDTPPRPTNELQPSSSRYFYSHIMQPVICDVSYCNLVIVPPTLLGQWEAEIKKHTNLAPYIIQTCRILKQASAPAAICKADFVLATSSSYHHITEFAAAHSIRWNNIFIDEASSIYFTANTPPLDFQFLWLISSSWIPFLFKGNTPSATNLLHLCSDPAVSTKIHAGLIEWLTAVKDDNIQFQTSLASSAFLKNYIPFSHPSRSALIVRTATQTQLPPIQTRTIPCTSGSISLAALFTADFDRVNIPAIYEQIGIKQLTLAETMEAHPDRAAIIQSKSADDCAICLDTPRTRTMTSCCNHSFCGACILRHMVTRQHTCPTCRAQLRPNMLNWLAENMAHASAAAATQIRSRKETCISILKESPQNRVIIYTMYDNIYYQLADELVADEIRVEKLDANPYNVARSVKAFLDGTSRVLCVTNPEHCRGISLTPATHIIFYHELPFYELRQLLLHSAQRIGRSAPLNVVHLETAGL